MIETLLFTQHHDQPLPLSRLKPSSASSHSTATILRKWHPAFLNHPARHGLHELTTPFHPATALQQPSQKACMLAPAPDRLAIAYHLRHLPQSPLKIFDCRHPSQPLPAIASCQAPPDGGRKAQTATRCFKGLRHMTAAVPRTRPSQSAPPAPHFSSRRTCPSIPHIDNSFFVLVHVRTAPFPTSLAPRVHLEADIRISNVQRGGHVPSGPRGPRGPGGPTAPLNP